MQGSQSRSVSLKQAEEEVLLKAGDAGSSTFLPFDTDLTSQQRAAFKCVLRSSLSQWHGSLTTDRSSLSALIGTLTLSFQDVMKGLCPACMIDGL